MKRGKLITFEGSDGVGKSTQIDKFVSFLENQGIEVFKSREPGGTEIGEKIRDLVQFDSIGESLTHESELLLFCVSRSQLIHEKILPKLEKGIWVIIDRFFDSTTVYQGFGRGVDLGFIDSINKFVCSNLVPDLTYLFDLEVKKRIERVKLSSKKEDRIENENHEFYRKIRNGYLELAKKYKNRIVLLDASLSKEEIFENIKEEFFIKNII